MTMNCCPPEKSKASRYKDHLNFSILDFATQITLFENFRGASPLFSLPPPVLSVPISFPYSARQFLSTHSYSSLDLASFLPLSLPGLPCPGLRELHHHSQVRDKIPFHSWIMCCIRSSFHRKLSASHSAPDQMESHSLANTRLCSHKKQGQIF